jgi:hypothetical protein
MAAASTAEFALVRSPGPRIPGRGFALTLKTLTMLGMASLAVGTGVATAHATSFKSEIEITGTVGQTVQDFQVYGEVRSEKAKCVRGRTVKIFSVTPNGLKLIDTDRTSGNGFFFGGGNFGNEVDGARVKVVRRKIGRRGHAHVCKPDADTLRIL